MKDNDYQYHKPESKMIVKVKLKDYKYQIAGIESDKPLNDCIQAIGLGFALFMVVIACFTLALMSL